MLSSKRAGGRLPRKAIVSGLGAWALAISPCPAGDGPPAPSAPAPGFQGFGLNYHLGRGYGGDAAGVGLDGGYPFYGGPGYPHPAPALRRFKLTKNVPFAYFGGPGAPTPGHPNFFGAAGPLAADVPVVTVGGEPGNSGDFGQYSGSIPYPETAFAPALPEIDPPRGGNFPATPPLPSPDPAPAPAADLGIDAVPFVASGNRRGLKITRVSPRGAAEKAGLRPGDVIGSINGYATESPGNLAWIVAHGAPDGALTMRLIRVKDGDPEVVAARLR